MLQKNNFMTFGVFPVFLDQRTVIDNCIIEAESAGEVVCFIPISFQNTTGNSNSCRSEGNPAEGFGSRICTALFLCQGSCKYGRIHDRQYSKR